jgi:hypothetical protein
MTTDRLIRWGGLVMLLGSISLAVFPFVHPNHDPDGFRSAIWVPAHLTAHIGAISFLFGLTAIFARQGERNGWLGLAGYVLATLGTAQLLMVAWVEFFIIPFLSLNMPSLADTPPPGVEVAGMLMNVSMAVGYLTLGLGVIRAKVLPFGAGLLLTIAAPMFSLSDMVIHAISPDSTLDLFMPTAVLFAIAMGWLGLSLATDASQRRPRRMAALMAKRSASGSASAAAHSSAFHARPR